MKTILLTGATDGIGLETAKSLAEGGHTLLIHGRNEQKLFNVVEQLKAISPQASIFSYQADLSEFSQVNSLIKQINDEHQSLDVIINNAGVFKTSSKFNSAGLDVRFVVNTLSPIHLATSLMPLLTDTARIVNLSSAAQAPVNLAALTGSEQLSDDFQAYAQSKLALTMWSQEFAKQIKSEQIVVAVNPGSLLASKMVKEGFGLQGNDLSIGSDILIRAALSDEFEKKSGLYFDNDNKMFTLPHPDAQNETQCSALLSALNSMNISNF